MGLLQLKNNSVVGVKGDMSHPERELVTLGTGWVNINHVNRAENIRHNVTKEKLWESKK